MKTGIILIHSITLVIMLFILPYIYAQAPLPQEVFEKVSPAMMMLKSYDVDSSLYSTGSAVAVGDSGIVYTNMHIFKDAKWMELSNGSATIRNIKIIGFDPDKDILILKIPAGIIHGIKIANSDSVKIGEPVYAIGNPLGFTNTFSNGILSGIRIKEDKQLQFTASISPGSSGGALLNSNGEIIGITSLYYKNGQNLNFAVPINYFSSVALVDICDTAQIQLLKDIVGIYNSDQEINNDAALIRLSLYTLSSISNRNALYTAAKIYYDRQLKDLALNTCNWGIQKFPRDKQFILLRGNIFCSKGDIDSAIDDFDKALQIDSLYESALLERAYYFRYIKTDYNSALKDLFKLVALDAKNEFLYLDIAEIYRSLYDTMNAISYLQKSYAYDGFTAAMYYERGSAFSNLNKYDEAIADYTSAISLNSENVDYYFSRAIAYSKSGNHNNAMSDYFAVLSFGSRNVTALNNLAYEYFDIGDYAKAEENFLRALSIDDKHFDSYIGLAITAHKLNKIKECVRNMYKAIKLRPELENGMAGLNSLKDNGYFWCGLEMRYINEVFVMMGIEDSKYAMFEDDGAVESAPKPRQIKMAQSVK